jgi:hypothetical protein
VPSACAGVLPLKDAPGRAYVVDGLFHRAGDSQALVTWAILDQCGVTPRGPAAQNLEVAVGRLHR